MKKNKLLSLALASSLFLSSTGLPAAIAASPPHHTVTWQEFINNHPNPMVEYRYTKHQPVRLVASNLANGSQKVRLSSGTPVIVKITEAINSGDATEGSSISFSVVQDVKVNDAVVIKAGSMGQAQITALEEAGRIGQSGKITITDFSVRAVDGSFIPLRGTITNKAADKMVTSGVLAWVICPLFLLMKGKEATIPAGLEKTTYTASDVDVTIQKQ